MRAAIAALFLVAATGVAGAGEKVEVDARVQHLARSLMSPFCPGKTLQSCTSRGAAVWLDEIRGWVRAGDSDDAIVARLQARVPDFDLSDTPGGSADWLLWVAPIALMTLIVLPAARRLRRREPLRVDDDDIDPELLAAIEDELRDLD